MRSEMQLHVRGTQRFEDREPETIELTTEATMEEQEGVLYLSYPESELTGLEGTVTTFEIRLDRVILRRRGTVNQEMEFVEGKTHHSLYRIPEGALMVTVRTTSLEDKMTLAGGTLRVVYRIELESTAAGEIEYLLTAVPKAEEAV